MSGDDKGQQSSGDESELMCVEPEEGMSHEGGPASHDGGEHHEDEHGHSVGEQAVHHAHVAHKARDGAQLLAASLEEARVLAPHLGEAVKVAGKALEHAEVPIAAAATALEVGVAAYNGDPDGVVGAGGALAGGLQGATWGAEAGFLVAGPPGAVVGGTAGFIIGSNIGRDRAVEYMHGIDDAVHGRERKTWHDPRKREAREARAAEIEERQRQAREQEQQQPASPPKEDVQMLSGSAATMAASAPSAESLSDSMSLMCCEPGMEQGTPTPAAPKAPSKGMHG